MMMVPPNNNLLPLLLVVVGAFVGTTLVVDAFATRSCSNGALGVGVGSKTQDSVVLFASSQDDSSPSPDALEICQRLDLAQAFDRWRFVQKLLDLEVRADDVNAILYHVLDRYARAPKSSSATANQGSPERTRERLRLIQQVLEQAQDGTLPALTPPDFTTGLLDDLEQLLPDPEDEEDAHKSVWDGVTELHGREAVKIDERTGGAEWKASCLAARVLLFYDFLQKGLLVEEGFE